jgi:hypothetical protein
MQSCPTTRRGCQQQVQAGTPPPPAAGTSPAGTPPADDPLAQGRQTKRILYVVPNFRAVSADQQLPPQTVKEKFKTAMLDSVDYSSFIFVAGQAGVAQATTPTLSFGQGAKGYGRYYWHTLADAINENTWVEFIVPSVLHQDTRYYTLGKGEFGKRLGYAFTRIVVTRSDEGHEGFQFQRDPGSGRVLRHSQSLLSEPGTHAHQDLPAMDHEPCHRWRCTFVFKEVWPDINNAIFHQKGLRRRFHP